MRIGILGSGLMGGKLGRLFARSGHDVVFSYARFFREPFQLSDCDLLLVPSDMFFGVYEAKRKANRPSLVYCGDDAPSKEVAAGLIRDVGFEAIDAGPLRIARYTEPFALLMGQLAYEGTDAPELSYRFERYAE